MTWRDQAACLDTDPEQWFPARPSGDEADRVYAARVDALKAICAACPVVDACLTEALRLDDAGFRGGLTEEERRETRRRRGARFSAALEAALADEKAARAARRGAA